MSFLHTIIVLIVVSFTICCSNALSCGTSGGQVDTFQKDMCNCYSGWAPSTVDGIDCNTHAKCAPAMPSDTDTTSTNAPKKPQTWFNNDRLEIAQQVPIVANRKSAWIQFMIPNGIVGAGTPGLRTCGYPGVLWNKTINALDCIDEYRASLPWSQHIPCGFAHDTRKSTNATTVISSTMVTTVVEVFTVGNQQIERLSSTSHMISVSFANQKTLSSGTFTVNIPDPTSAGVLSKYVVSNSMFDPATGATIVDFITTALWPYKLAEDTSSLNNAFTGVSPPLPGLAVGLSVVQDTVLSCENIARSTCTQKWRATIATIGACINNIQGIYTFREPLLCRDNVTQGAAGACPRGISSISLTINIQKTELCAGTPVDTSDSSSYLLTPYSDAAHTTTNVQFQTGEKVYWTFQIANPLVSIKSVTFNSIQLSEAQTGGVDLLYNSAAGGPTSVGNAVSLEIQGLSSTISAGTTGSLSFSYNLRRASLSNTLGGLRADNLEVQLVTSVIVDIQYYGNTKRSIEMDLSNMDAKVAGSDTKAIRVVAVDLMSQTSEQAEEKVNGAPTIRSGLVFVISFFCAMLLL